MRELADIIQRYGEEAAIKLVWTMKKDLDAMEQAELFPERPIQFFLPL